MELNFNRLNPEQQKYFDTVYAEKLRDLIKSLGNDSDVVRRSAGDIAKWICRQHFEKQERANRQKQDWEIILNEK